MAKRPKTTKNKNTVYEKPRMKKVIIGKKTKADIASASGGCGCGGCCGCRSW